MSKDGYYHPVLDDCGKEVELPNPNYGFTISSKRKVQMIITTPRGRLAIFNGCSDKDAHQAITEFMESCHVR